MRRPSARIRPTPNTTIHFLPVLITLTLLGFPVVVRAGIVPGHRLPTGAENSVRAREIDVLRLSADLRFDMERERIDGVASIRFTPLRSELSSFSLDAADLSIESVEMPGSPDGLSYSLEGRKLRVDLPRPAGPGEELTIRIAYSCRPRSGIYFKPATEQFSAQAWNYGEGGLHYAWIPLYNDTNDRFAVEFRVTVERPLVALSNGRLIETVENRDGTRTFHWIQEEEIPNYLLAMNVGEFAEVRLEPARVGARRIPLSVWGPPGSEEAIAHTFRNSTRMVEFFSERFGYPYVWPKFDQVTLREFEGAMETTTMVGYTETYQRRSGDPVDSGPAFELAYPIWEYENTIAHELAHHWFGDLVTCRSLGSIWLNESFATYAHTVWNGHDQGEDDLTYQRWRYLHNYLDYIQDTGEIRPLEYQRYDASGEMYQAEITYVKGALVIHMLRHVLGDGDFYRAIAHYLDKHAFRGVESIDLLAALEQTTGRDLKWFFDDWIVGGGGRPSIKAKWSWSKERHEIDLTLKQVQADQPFENLFHLPIDVEIVTANGARTETVRLDAWETRVSLAAGDRPLSVNLDPGNWLVAELHVRRDLDEVLYQLGNGGLAVQLRAARQIATDFPRRAEGIAALARVLADQGRHWGLRQEAAVALGGSGRPEAVDALIAAAGDPDRRVRRAVAIALGDAGGPSSGMTLRRMIEKDLAEDVIGVAAAALGRMHAPGAADFLRQQLTRKSRWWSAIQVGALMGLAELEDPGLVSTFKEYVIPRYRRHVRIAALDGWFRADPGDGALAAQLRKLVQDRNATVRRFAIETLGKLHRRADLEFLKEFADSEPDPNFALAAREAIDEIAAFTGD